MKRKKLLILSVILFIFALSENSFGEPKKIRESIDVNMSNSLTISTCQEKVLDTGWNAGPIGLYSCSALEPLDGSFTYSFTVEEISRLYDVIVYVEGSHGVCKIIITGWELYFDGVLIASQSGSWTGCCLSADPMWYLKLPPYLVSGFQEILQSGSSHNFRLDFHGSGAYWGEQIRGRVIAKLSTGVNFEKEPPSDATIVGIIDEPLDEPLKVKLTSCVDNLSIPNETVTFTITQEPNGSDAYLSPGILAAGVTRSGSKVSLQGSKTIQVLTNANGIASVEFHTGKEGSYVVEARYDGIPNNPLILAYNIEEIAIDEMRIIMDNNGDEKDDIDEYLPEANQYITMVALLYNKGQRVTDLKGGNFIVNFHIENTSNFTGYCNNGNFGTPTIPDERDTDPDYKLENANPDGISPVSFSNDGKAVAVLRCDDYGGHTTLKALVKLTDRLELNAEKEIPKDENDNEIADNWEYETHQGLVPNTDDDSKPQGANFGDGLTNFEEYRGFITVSGFIRTNPKKKDIFVYNQDGLSFGEAVQLDLVFHEVSDYDYTKPHTLIINRNGSNTQHIVFLHRITEEPKEPTETGGVSNNWLPEAFNVPLSRPEIKIYSTVIQGVSNGSGARCGIPFDVPYGDIYNVVIAHEFGHIVDIEHNDAPKSGCRGYPDIMKSPLNVCSMPKCFANTTISKNMRLRP